MEQLSGRTETSQLFKDSSERAPVRHPLRWSVTVLWLFILALAAARGQNAATTQSTGQNAVAETVVLYDVLHPFWTRSEMDGEPVLFVQKTNSSLATAKLLFPANKILSMTSGDGRETYEAGRDFVWASGSNTLVLTPTSRIPSKTMAELFPAKGSPRSFSETADGKSSIFFAEGGAIFQSLQVNVTYEHQAHWNGYFPLPASRELSRTISKLQRQQPLKLVVLGDSISHGANASGTFHSSPYQPPYDGLVKQAIEVEYGSKIILSNLSVGGTDSKWGVTQAHAVSDEHPDLVILAFGMNDASVNKMSPSDYRDHIKAIMDQARASNPEVDFILVATMTGNPDWIKTDQYLYSEYRSTLIGFAGPGIAVADMTSIWRDLLKVKKFTDITGNGINHPNDFGHRVYAQVILSLLK